MKVIKTTCPQCGKVTNLQMTDEQYDEYVSGRGLIQNIFPYWSPAKREMLITGICPDCWNKIFSFYKE